MLSCRHLNYSSPCLLTDNHLSLPSLVSAVQDAARIAAERGAKLDIDLTNVTKADASQLQSVEDKL